MIKIIKMQVFASLVFALTLTSCATAQPSGTTKPTNKLVPLSEVKWSPLNPARGAQSPQAGNLWGDRGETVATGFLVKFVDGFSSPPHIHNVTYRGVVISGLIHNDDPDAKEMWMPPGSFWTQPAGESHITAAKGHENMAYIEINEGPYLVRPIDQSFDNGERPVNLDKSNIVWVDASSLIEGRQLSSSRSGNQPQVAFLWGTPQGNQLNGRLIKFPAGFNGKIRSHGSIFQAVVIQGNPQYQMPDEAQSPPLEPGSSFSSEGSAIHQVSTNAESIIYVRTNDSIELTE